MIRCLYYLLCFFFLMAGCVGPLTRHDDIHLKVVAWKDYPRFTDDMWYDGLECALKQSLEYLRRLDPDKHFFWGKDAYSVSHVIHSLEFFLTFVHTRPSALEMNRFIENHYRIYRSVADGKPGEVFFTGYYEPILDGSLEKNGSFIYPVYGRPLDLTTIDLGLFDAAWKGKTLIGRYDGQTVIPYPDRKSIDVEKCLEGKAIPLVWLKDPVDAFFLQIQGSGKVNINGPEPLNIHYHISNGRPYRSIGKLLIETKKIEPSKMSMQSIRAYLESHPDELQDILNYNPCYVFFKIEKEGPKGFLDVVLTPGRSVALDRKLFPPGALAFIETHKPLIDPDGTIQKWNRFSRFVLNQDTGGAIQGPGRADLFWGNGPYAEIAAGHMQHRGTLYFLILKPDA